MTMDKPIRLVRRVMIKDDLLSPSSLELYDRMSLVTCEQAESLWNLDWTKCPVCMAEVDDTGYARHWRTLVKH
jgi:hypothetical protein